MSESWLPVPNYEELYEVSSTGRVRSLNRLIVDKNGRSLALRGGLLKPVTSRGYGYVGLSASGTVRRFGVHQLVCRAFNGAPSSSILRPEVRHFDGNKLNNAPDNLLWGSSSDNKNDSVRQGVHFPAREKECKYGHAFTAANTRIKVLENGKKRRTCLTCRTRRHREWKDKIRSKTYHRRDEICKRGHRRTPENTIIGAGRRRCRECAREYHRGYQDAKLNGEMYSRAAPQKYGVSNA